MTTETTQDLIDISTKMAQELQDIIGDAETAGCKDPFPGTKALIDEWEQIYSQTEGHGMTMLITNESIETANPGRPNTAFDPFVTAILRQVGASLEIPYELLIKHFTASYSASRAAMKNYPNF